MDATALAIPDVKLLTPKKFGDERGYFAETYNRQIMSALGINDDFVQDNQSLSRDVGVVRGLHFQKPPFTQSKLLRVLRGRVFDVVVDIRFGSPYFGQHVGVELCAEDCAAIYVPKGFAHGFMTLSPDTEILYKVSDFYAPDHETGIHWRDPDLNINWPLAQIGGFKKALLSDKDRILTAFRDLPEIFGYGPY